MLGAAGSGGGLEDWEEGLDKQEGGEMVGLPLCFEAVGCELVGNCHDLRGAKIVSRLIFR